jgi:hypothetical protein
MGNVKFSYGYGKTGHKGELSLFGYSHKQGGGRQVVLPAQMKNNICVQGGEPWGFGLSFMSLLYRFIVNDV